MTTRTTDALLRVDMLMAQAEWFAEAWQYEEAIARAKQVIAYAEREIERESDPRVRADLDQRALLAEAFLVRFGQRIRDRRGRLCIQASDAMLPDTWT